MKTDKTTAEKAKNRRSGLTLVEVMVSTFLVSMGLATFLTAFTAASRTTEAAARRIRAMHTARLAMEDLRSRSYNEIAVGTRTYTNDVQYTVTIASGFPSTKDICVGVSWKNPGQKKLAKVELWSSVAACIHP